MTLLANTMAIPFEVRLVLWQFQETMWLQLNCPAVRSSVVQNMDIHFAAVWGMAQLVWQEPHSLGRVLLVIVLLRSVTLAARDPATAHCEK